MGVIRRQGLKQSIVSFAGVGIGALNTLFVYPFCLTTTEFGLLMFLLSAAMLLVPFVFLGSNTLTVRYFPHFRDDASGHRGFLTLLVGLLVLGLILLFTLALLFKPIIYGWYAPLERAYLPFVLPLTALIAASTLLAAYTSNFLRIVVPTIFNELLIKLVLPALVVGYYLAWWPFLWIIYGLLVMYGLSLLGNIVYTASLGQLRFGNPLRFLRRRAPLRREMQVFAGYGIMGSAGDQLAGQLDLSMLTSLIDPTAAAVYRIGSLVGNVVDVPRKSMRRIMAPILAKHMQASELPEVDVLYKKSSLTLFIMGLLVFGGIWVNVDNLFRLMPNGADYAAGKWVILLLGVTNLINMVTSINDGILSYSRYFRWRFYFIILLGILNIGFNYWLIPRYSIYGAALATLATVSLYNLGKTLLVYHKLDLQPLTRGTAVTLGIALFAYALTLLLPSLTNVWLDLPLRSLLYAIPFGALVYWANLSEEINQLPGIWSARLRRFFASEK